MNSNRRGQASSTLQLVNQRHEAIQNIERQMVELAQLFEQLNQEVLMQEAKVEQIDTQGEVVKENVEQANVQIETAIGSARARNRKKWWCLLIALIIIIIIVVVVVIVIEINKSK